MPASLRTCPNHLSAFASASTSVGRSSSQASSPSCCAWQTAAACWCSRPPACWLTCSSHTAHTSNSSTSQAARRQRRRQWRQQQLPAFRRRHRSWLAHTPPSCRCCARPALLPACPAPREAPLQVCWTLEPRPLPPAPCPLPLSLQTPCPIGMASGWPSPRGLMGTPSHGGATAGATPGAYGEVGGIAGGGSSAPCGMQLLSPGAWRINRGQTTPLISPGTGGWGCSSECGPAGSRCPGVDMLIISVPACISCILASAHRHCCGASPDRR